MKTVVLIVVSILCISFGLFLSLSLATAESEGNSKGKWLGVYVGPEIPGFKVVRSAFVMKSAWQSVGNMIPGGGKNMLENDLIAICRDGTPFGLGITNLRTTAALGAVPGPASTPNTYISNGMYKEIYGDCVLEVAPLAR